MSQDLLQYSLDCWVTTEDFDLSSERLKKTLWKPRQHSCKLARIAANQVVHQPNGKCFRCCTPISAGVRDEPPRFALHRAPESDLIEVHRMTELRSLEFEFSLEPEPVEKSQMSDVIPNALVRKHASQ